jgi:hypothetical protein
MFLNTYGTAPRRLDRIGPVSSCCISLLFSASRYGFMPTESGRHPQIYISSSSIPDGMARESFCSIGATLADSLSRWMSRHGCSLTAAIANLKPQDEALFSYPLYLAFILAPTIGFSLPTIENIFRIVLPVTVIATALLWIQRLDGS